MIFRFSFFVTRWVSATNNGNSPMGSTATKIGIKARNISFTISFCSLLKSQDRFDFFRESHVPVSLIEIIPCPWDTQFLFTYRQNAGNDNRHRGYVIADDLMDTTAVHFWHLDVQQDQVKLAGIAHQDLDDLQRVGRFQDLELHFLEQSPVFMPHFLVVIDDQYLSHVVPSFCK